MAIKKIMVVDDSPTDQHHLREMLSRNGYEVVIASGGEEALAKARSHQPDLILMDVVMPGLNGFQATRKLSQDADTRHIPVIICTTKSQETDRIWGLKQGAKDYVTKPLDEAELLSKVAAHA